MRFSPLIFATLLILNSCKSIEDVAGNNPIIDMQGVNLGAYDADLAECRGYADEVAIAQKTGAGVVSGAVVGGVVGAIVGNGDTAQRGAGIGAIGGGARGIATGIRERERVIKRCLTGRD